MNLTKLLLILVLMVPSILWSQETFYHPVCEKHYDKSKCTELEIEAFLNNYLIENNAYENEGDTIDISFVLEVDEDGLLHLNDFQKNKGTEQQEKLIQEAFGVYTYGVKFISATNKRRKSKLSAKEMNFIFTNPVLSEEKKAELEKLIGEEVYKVVEEMPTYKSCTSIVSKVLRSECTSRTLLQFVNKNIVPPQEAIENKIKGTIVIRFIIEKDGSISNPEIVRDIGGGCGEEGLRLVNLMNEQKDKWISGKHLGVPVRVYFNLPISFRF